MHYNLTEIVDRLIRTNAIYASIACISVYKPVINAYEFIS